MSRVKLLLLAVAAALAASTAASASASAIEWVVEGGSLSASESVEAFALSSSTLTTELTGGTKIIILCDAAKASGTVIPKVTGEAPSGVAFTSCTVTEPSKCKVSTSLTTKPLNFEVKEITGGAVLLATTPKAGAAAEYITIEVTGCAGEGEYEVTGKVACEAEKPEEQAIEKNCSFVSGTDQELKFGAKAATFASTFTFKLTGGNKGKRWGVGVGAAGTVLLTPNPLVIPTVNTNGVITITNETNHSITITSETVTGNYEILSSKRCLNKLIDVNGKCEVEITRKGNGNGVYTIGYEYTGTKTGGEASDATDE